MGWMPTLMFQIVDYTEIDEHLEEIAENLVVEHLFYTISIVTNNRTSAIFSTALVVKHIDYWGHQSNLTGRAECTVIRFLL